MAYLFDFNKSTKGFGALPLIFEHKGKELRSLNAVYRTETGTIRVTAEIFDPVTKAVTSGEVEYGFYDKLRFRYFGQNPSPDKDLFISLSNGALLAALASDEDIAPTPELSLPDMLFEMFAVILKQKHMLNREARDREFTALELALEYIPQSAPGGSKWPAVAIKAYRGMSSLQYSFKMPQTGVIDVEPYLRQFSSVYN